MSDKEKEAVFLTDDEELTESINLSTLAASTETATGSFDFDQPARNPFGKLFDALPMPALLINEVLMIVFANIGCEVMGVKHADVHYADFGGLFPDARDAARARNAIKQVFLDRKQQAYEGVVGISPRLIWGKVHFRSLRFQGGRFMLVLVENLTAEKRQQVLNQKHQEELRKAHGELEKRVQERTAELVQRNRELNEEISRRKAIEQSLRSSERRFKAVFETAQDSIFIKNAERRYTHINPAMLKILQVPLNEIIGKTDDELFGHEETKHVKNLEDRVLRGQIIEAEYAVKLKEGSITINCVRVPLRDAAGNVSGICGIARDVTERKGILPADRGDALEYPSAAIQETLKQVNLASRTDSIVLFLGESGSGKDHLARMLHDKSNRSGGPFLAINCAALAPELVESELFGHERGSFTGSQGRKRGLLELAEGGTLVLNEIGELPLPLQAKLLTFLDTQSFMRVGGEKPVQVNTRLVAATNRDLEKEAEAGNFRKDLFYRLNVFTIRVPPLRHRIEDLPILAHAILVSLMERMGRHSAPDLPTATQDALAGYGWPGNVRELRNVLERALILCDGETITVDNLGLSRKHAPADAQEGELKFSVTVGEGTSMDEALRETKRTLVQDALRLCGGSVKDAAELLGISRASLNHHMKYLGIRR